MAAIGQVNNLLAAQLLRLEAQNPQSTAEKIQQFFSRIEGIGTLFSILAGITVASLWGVQFGLLAAGIGALATLAIANCLSAKADPAPAIENNPQPQPANLERRDEMEAQHFRTLGLPFAHHFDLRTRLVLDFGPQMDRTQVQLVSVRNVHYDFVYRPMGGEFVLNITPTDGYEINLQTPNGPVRYYFSLEGGHAAHPIDAQNVVPR